eukprot:TRINITY_DN5314_c0_g5_i3.p1 TRINITY_DN5314_c0_g5~~TRINITY_DN5314_c0_g5_i3.p1  ORF type:complete len:134 (+),score=13.53 TRINITY_DN5314_c0_g5_i3:25-426(+)
MNINHNYNMKYHQQRNGQVELAIKTVKPILLTKLFKDEMFWEIVLLFFRSTQGFCKLIYLVRCCPTSTTTIPFRQFDRRVMETVRYICGLVAQIPYPRQLSLPLKMEGLDSLKPKTCALGPISPLLLHVATQL